MDAANMLATAEVSPSLHDSSTSIKAVSPPIGSLHRRPDLMTQRLFKEIAGESAIFSPGPKRSSAAMMCKSAAAWRASASISPTGREPARCSRRPARELVHNDRHSAIAPSTRSSGP